MDLHGSEVRGYGSFSQRAAPFVRVLAFFVDLSWAAGIVYAYTHWVYYSPILSWFSIFTVLILVVSLWFLQRIVFGATFGQWVWQIKPKSWKAKFGSPVYQSLGRSWLLSGLAVAMTFASIGITSRVYDALFLRHPIMEKADILELGAFIPPKEERKAWYTLPFYYASGAWPKMFHWKPILFSLPYRKGPPKKFAGRISARWHNPKIRLTLLGPQTPLNEIARNDLRDCLLKTGIRGGRECARIRHATLKPHYAEMRKLGLKEFSLRWFEVVNFNIPVTEQAKGIYLRGSNDKYTQERYVLVNGLSSHQTIVLSRENNDAGTEASQLIQKSVRSLRVFYDLSPGRALVNQQISGTQMRDLEGISDTVSYISRLAEIQAYLISKISVDPKSHQAYFHLGGTALMMAKTAGKERVQKSSSLPGEVLSLLDQLSVIAKPLVRTAYLYARDVNPGHPRTVELEQMWIEAKRY